MDANGLYCRFRAAKARRKCGLARLRFHPRDNCPVTFLLSMQERQVRLKCTEGAPNHMPSSLHLNTFACMQQIWYLRRHFELCNAGILPVCFEVRHKPLQKGILADRLRVTEDRAVPTRTCHRHIHPPAPPWRVCWSSPIARGAARRETDTKDKISTDLLSERKPTVPLSLHRTIEMMIASFSRPAHTDNLACLTCAHDSNDHRGPCRRLDVVDALHLP